MGLAKLPTNSNEWADFWRYQIGVNVIPADTKNKTTWIKWSQYMNQPITEEQHEKWKSDDDFSKGIALMPGKVWHGAPKKGLYLNFIDLDNEKAIEEFCTRNGTKVPLQDLAKYMIIEQHSDQPDRAHAYCYSNHPFRKKSSDKVGGLSNKIDQNLIPAIEVKGSGEHGIAFCAPSITASGFKREIIGTLEPNIIDKLELHINDILKKYGLSYLESPQDKIPIEDLFKEDTIIFEGHNRHEGVLRIMESLLQRNKRILPLERIRELAWEQNLRVCQPPLDEKEFERQWKDALKFIRKKSNSHASCGSQMKNDCKNEHDMVVNMTNYLTSRYSFVTMKDSSEIFYYENGRYVRNGEVEIKIELEKQCPSIRTSQVNEIIEKIKRITYRNRSDFDVDTNIINLKNGLLNIVTREFRQHSSDYLSTTQLPVNYDPKASCPEILKFLAQVAYPKNVFTIFQFLGYSLYRSAKYKKALMCVGVGDNGKSVFLELIELFLGQRNVSHTSLHELVEDRFATADLYGKFANTFADLRSGRLTDTSIFKTLVSGDEIRAQRKHGQPFDFSPYAKLIFSANQIPQVDDKSYAYFKRWIILRFDNVFDDKNSDPNIIKRLTTDSELSGLLNLALIGLRKLIDDGGFVNAGDVYEVQKEYESSTNSVKNFIEANCVTKPSDTTVSIVCKNLYIAYTNYCKIRKITPFKDNSFGAQLISLGIRKERRMIDGFREYFYLGVELKSEILPSILKNP